MILNHYLKNKLNSLLYIALLLLPFPSLFYFATEDVLLKDPSTNFSKNVELNNKKNIEVPMNNTNVTGYSDWSIQASPPLVYKNSRENSPELIKEINILGMLLRDIIYYPLYWYTEENQTVYEKLLPEKEYYSRFWSDKEPRDLNLENAEIIKQNYIVRDQPIVVYECDNKKITTVCRLIESKESSKNNGLNVLILPGSLSTLDNNLFSFYDFLLAHSKQQNSSSIRLVIFGQYETTLETNSEKTTYKPASFDALGEVLKRTIETLNEQCGKFDVIYAHSAGCKALASLLKRSKEELLPVLLHFDRGASSMFEASRNYFLGRPLYLIADYSNLTLNIDQEIIDYFDRCSKMNIDLQESTCLITGVAEDFFYPGKSNLARSDFVDKMPKKLKFANWMFNPPEQINHSRGHHSWRLTHFNKSYLLSSQGNIEMLPKENLAESILRLSQSTSSKAVLK